MVHCSAGGIASEHGVLHVLVEQGGQTTALVNQGGITNLSLGGSLPVWNPPLPERVPKP